MSLFGEIVVILVLILANAYFVMSELALVSARSSRLQPRAEAGNLGAQRALEMGLESAKAAGSGFFAVRLCDWNLGR